jgi:hypothetical protein
MVLGEDNSPLETLPIPMTAGITAGIVVCKTGSERIHDVAHEEISPVGASALSLAQCQYPSGRGGFPSDSIPFQPDHRS